MSLMITVLQQTVILRGFNLPINAKLPDFMPLKDKTPLQVLPLYGTSVARLLFTWEAFEPQRGVYSMEYLDYYVGLVNVSAPDSFSSHPLATCTFALSVSPSPHQ